MRFIFEYPSYIYFLFIIPLIIFIYFFSLRVGKSKAIKFANFDAISKIEGIDILSKNITLLIFTCFIIFLLVFSLSGASLEVVSKVSDNSFVIAIDSSQSMYADDVKPSRIDAAKQIASSFVDSSPIGTRFAIVSFSGNSLIEKEVSDNKNDLSFGINNIEISDVYGTDIYEAVLTASKLLKSYDNKILILLSDGQINVGTIDDAIDLAKEDKIKIHTIALGTKEGGNTFFGISKVDEDSLKALSYNTEGEYFFADDTSKLESSFNLIYELKQGEKIIPLRNYFLIMSLFLILISYFLNNTRYRMFP